MRAPCRHPRVPAQSGISDESLTPELDADAAIVDRLMKMVIEAGTRKPLINWCCKIVKLRAGSFSGART